MANRRIERLNEQLRREISDILRKSVRDPRIGIPTITRVDITPDLWVARVFVRTSGTPEERAGSLEGLDGASAFIRHELRGLKVRRVPELRFEIDTALDHASRIDELLTEVGPIPAERPATEAYLDDVDEDEEEEEYDEDDDEDDDEDADDDDLDDDDDEDEIDEDDLDYGDGEDPDE
jgi:ribosome-binding factor A